jgi:tetratricopeptide (TPR) repeat protein
MKPLARLSSLLLLCGALVAPQPARAQGLAESMNEAQKALNDAELLAQQGKPKEARAQYLQAIRLNPRFTKAFELYSLFLFSRGRHREGAKAMRVGLKLNPSVELKAHLAMHLYRLGSIGEAYNLFKESASAQRDRYEIQVVYSQAAMLMEDYPAVAEAIRDYFAYRPDTLAAKDYVLRVQLATALMRSDQTPRAERELSEVMRSRPNYTRAKVARAELLLRRGKCSEAEEAYRQLAPKLKKLDLSLQIGETYLCLKRNREAYDVAGAFLGKQDAVLKEVLASPESRKTRNATAVGSVRQGLLLRGSAALKLGMLEQALDDFRKAEILTGGDKVELSIAQVLFQLRQYDKVIEKLRRQLQRKEPPPEVSVLVLRAAVRSANKKLAVGCAERLAKTPRATADHYYYAGIAYNSAGRFDRAVEVLHSATNLAPADTRSRDELVRSYAFLAQRALKGKQPDTAIAHLQSAAKLSPRSAVVHRDLALLHLRQGSGQRALEAAQLALAFAPRDPAANRLAGRALALGGKHKEAIARYQRALKELPRADANTQAKVLVELAVSRIATGALADGAADLEQAARLIAKNERMAELLGMIQRDTVRLRIAHATELLDRNQTGAAAKELNLAQAQIKLLPDREQMVAQVMSMLGNIHAGNFRLAREQIRGFHEKFARVLSPTYQELGNELMTAYLELHAAAGPGKQRAAGQIEKLAARASSPARERLKDLAASAWAQVGERAFRGARGGQAKAAFAKVKKLARRESPELKHNVAVADYYGGAKDDAVKALGALGARVPMALCNLAVHFEAKQAMSRAYDFFHQCDLKGVRFPNLKALLAVKKLIFGK